MSKVGNENNNDDDHLGLLELTVVSLNVTPQARDLRNSGNKAELLTRLEEYLDNEEGRTVTDGRPEQIGKIAERPQVTSAQKIIPTKLINCCPCNTIYHLASQMRDDALHYSDMPIGWCGGSAVKLLTDPVEIVNSVFFGN